MQPSIEVDDQVYEQLQANAVAFIDTPNSVLRRILGLDPAFKPAQAPPARPSRPGRAVKGELLPEPEYELPILRYLAENGGRAPRREVIMAVGEELGDKLTALDCAPLKSGDIRWENRVAFVRLRLVERDELKRGSPRGTWEITDKGYERVQAS